MFYTYLWLREDGTPYYIGKGDGRRAYVRHYRRNGSVYCPPPMDRTVFYVAKDEAESLENEIALIWYYGRKDLGTGCLRNLTDGGEGTSGVVVSKQSRKRKSDALKDKPWSEAKRESNLLQPRKIPTCHPDRKHKAHDLCKPCAYRDWVLRTGHKKTKR